MKRFEDLIQPTVLHKATGTCQDFQKPVEQQRTAAAEFARLAAQSRLHLWDLGDPIPVQGTRFIIGVSTASLYDMRLLDALNQALDEGTISHDHMDVFNCVHFTRLEDFEPYVPGIRQVFHTPVVGWWEDRCLKAKASGAQGRRLLVERYGLSVDLSLKAVKEPIK